MEVNAGGLNIKQIHRLFEFSFETLNLRLRDPAALSQHSDMQSPRTIHISGDETVAVRGTVTSGRRGAQDDSDGQRERQRVIKSSDASAFKLSRTDPTEGISTLAAACGRCH
jgi:hypothetical protein